LNQRREKLSKFLTLILRHKPDILNIELRDDGFVPLDELVKRMKKKKGFGWVSEDDIISIVESDIKGRFEIKTINGKKFIRARYGHSRALNIDIKYPQVQPDEVDYLYHGTRADVLPWILREGLKPMNRKYVHLSPSPEDAIIVAQRWRGKPVILKIEAKKFLEDGGKIFKASEKVFLAEFIPPQYIRIHKYGLY